MTMTTIWKRGLLLSILFAVLPFALAQSAAPPPDRVLTGKVTGVQNNTYLDVPFDVPPGVHRISVDFHYTGADQHTILNLGIADPERFRGNSGGNKNHFTISETDATPSYLPGAIPAGTWKLLISVPNIRPGVVSTYRAEIRFNAGSEDRGFSLVPLEEGKRWYRGDLHMHTAHSDGSCTSQHGRKVPCPVFLTLQTAESQGLDFIAITDHNSDSQYDELRELQPYFDNLLLIPGREITTFWGHFNIFGITQFVDYRMGVNEIMRDVIAKGGIGSVNHAEAPTGEICMGCGWDPPSPVDMSLFTGVEAINGGAKMLSSVGFWEKQLSQGHRLTAIGGSDSHNALATLASFGSIGRPATVVEADNLSVPAILDGIRKGRAFIDLTSSHDKTIDLHARAGERKTDMGGDLAVANGQVVELNIHVVACSGMSVHFLVDGKESLAPMNLAGADEKVPAQWTSDGGRHWLRAEVRDGAGDLILLSNPIYINYPAR